MLSCCNKEFSATYKFDVADSGYLFKKIEFGRCPHCHKAIYREYKQDYQGNNINKILHKFEAERAFNKALFNRLIFISHQEGTRAKQYWCYGDFKHDNKRDERGNLIQLQIKRNMNGEEVENYGVARVIYK